MSSHSHSSSSSKRKREDKEERSNGDSERKRHKSRSRSRERKRHRSSSRERHHSSSHSKSHRSSRDKEDKHRSSRSSKDEKKDRSSRSHDDKKDEKSSQRSSNAVEPKTEVKEERNGSAPAQPPVASVPVKQEGAVKKPAIDVSALLSNIKATKAALLQTQKSTQTVSEQQQVGMLQKRLVEQKQKEGKDLATQDKVKNVEEIKSKINEKLQQMRSQGKLSTPSSSIAIPGGKAFMPPPLLLDQEGREIDKAGRVVSAVPKALPTTTMINKRVQREKVFKLEKPSTVETDPTKNPYYDPRMKAAKVQRGRRAFKFVDAGTYIKKGARMRTKLAKQILTSTSAAIAEQEETGSLALLGGMVEEKEKMDLDNSLMNLGMLKKAEEIIKEEEPIPDVEWWDMPILVDKTQYGDVGYKRKSKDKDKEKEKEKEDEPQESVGLNVKDGAITHLIEHPYILSPPSEKPPPGPMPLKLTKAEQKKMRRRARAERLREQQERVLLGLEKPPPNRVRLSNMMKVLGTEAVQDPTQIEHMVRAEMEQRVRNHEARNQARKLTPAQKRLKKLRKLKEDTTYLSRVAIFKVLNLTDEKHRYKVDINAQENNLTGRAVMFGNCNLILVEGGPKAILRYKKLLLRRVDWNAYVSQEESETKEEGEGGEGMQTDAAAVPKAAPKPVQPMSNNQCWLVWEGSVLKPAFKDFRFEQVFSDKAARKLLKDRRVAHYWDACKWSRLSDAVKVDL